MLLLRGTACLSAAAGREFKTWWSHAVAHAVLRQVSHHSFLWASYGNRSDHPPHPPPPCSPLYAVRLLDHYQGSPSPPSSALFRLLTSRKVKINNNSCSLLSNVFHKILSHCTLIGTFVFSIRKQNVTIFQLSSVFSSSFCQPVLSAVSWGLCPPSTSRDEATAGLFLLGKWT